MTKEKARRINTIAALALAVLVAGVLPLFLAPKAEADDRDLFRQASGAPYLFILFDNTGSMQRRVDNGVTATLRDDDPASRLFQAKAALDQVLIGTEGVNFGFATFPNQSGHKITNKTNSNQRVSNSESASNHCDGLEPNDDTNNASSNDDTRHGDTFNWLTTTTAVSLLPTGDLIPLDWNDNNVQRIRERMAPNLALGECPDPAAPSYPTCAGYGVERYFEDPVCTLEFFGFCFGFGPANGTHLPLLSPLARPFVAAGNTPLAGALIDFKTWFEAWKSSAEAGDPAFASGCREVAVVLVTDGFETCSGDPVAAATDLFNPGVSSTNPSIKTYVIGFAVNNSALDNIAAAGGTTEAFTATDQAQLVDAFSTIVGELQRQSRTFSTAAVPGVIGEAADTIFLTSFSPTDDGVSLWPGRIDAYKKPVPLLDVAGQKVPNRDLLCADPDTDEECLAWDAAEKLLELAPTQGQIDSDNYKVGFSATTRKIYFGLKDPVLYPEQVPEVRHYFQPSTDPAIQTGLYGEYGFGFADPTGAADAAAGEVVAEYFLKQKQALVLDPITRVEGTVDYVMGDIFHSDPVIIGDPQRFDYFAADLEGETEPCGASNNTKDRYPCFVRTHLGRRRVLVVGSNEGALHGFDAGTASRNSDGFIEFTAGTGEELWAYVPRAVMPKISDMSEGGGQQFTVDGPVTVDDVLRDPTVSAVDPPDPADLEWTTVAVAGLREGGRFYYAVDLTQPDVIDDLPPVGTGLPILDVRGPGCSNGGTGCIGEYPAPLWEFGDTWVHSVTGLDTAADEDGNGAADLGDTWSKPNIGRVRTTDGDMYVAIFGGGMDPDFKEDPTANPVTLKFEVSGNYLFMVDIETGKLVYKRRLDKIAPSPSVTTSPASAPSEPAAVDTDQDGYLDTIYIGNTAGYLYKVDISEPVAVATGVTIFDLADPDPVTGAPLARTVDRIIDSKWEPFPIFSTEGRPIYHPPSVIFVPELARYALAFGTGDREDLWSDDLLGGRFYVIVDEGFTPTFPTGLPLLAGAYEGFEATDTTVGVATDNLLTSPNGTFEKGYYLELDLKERMINKPFGLSGVVFLSTYSPETVTGTPGVCGSSGTSRLYSIFTTSGVGIRTNKDRFRSVGDFVTQPYVESGGVAGDHPDDETLPPDEGGACTAAELQAIRTSLMSQMPDECNFAQHSINVMTLQSQSGVECVVQIPVCVVGRNWKEF